ncbi:MAG: glycosyltransferase family 4 protein [Chloroflexi bacterium]|nr:glycosyltransferase family 4 protein [Chloroflexota bacterium]
MSLGARPRLLFMADAFDMSGGGEIVVDHLARAIGDRWDVTVLTTTRGADAVQQSEVLTVHQLHSQYHPRLRPVMSFMNPTLSRRVGRFLAELRPDVIHAWNVHSHLSYDALRLAHRAGARVVHTYQDAQPFCYSKYKCWLDPNAPLPKHPDYRANPRACRSCKVHFWTFPPRAPLIRTWLHRYVDVGVSVSGELAEALRQNGVTVHGVVPNGLPLHDPAVTGADGTRARARHGWGGEPLLVTGGRLHFFKGQNQAVDAFARVAAQHPTARLVILGGQGWYRDTLEERAAGLGLRDRVSFPGFLDRAAYHDVLAASSAFLNLSTYLDPFPTVNLESMALGVPVVATRLGGTPEAILDGETGLLVNPFDIERVADAALRLLCDDALRSRLGAGGRARVREHYTVEQMAARYEAIYRGESSMSEPS